jgi:hypothetical protein
MDVITNLLGLPLLDNNFRAIGCMGLTPHNESFPDMTQWYLCISSLSANKPLTDELKVEALW